jgi:hypothetical protein
VNRVTYHESRKQSDEHVDIQLLFERMPGELEDWTVRVNTADIQKATVRDVLTKRGLYLETPELRRDYERDLATCLSIVPQIGKQYELNGAAVFGRGHRSRTFRLGRGTDSTALSDRPYRVVCDLLFEPEQLRHEDDDEPSGSKDSSSRIDLEFWVGMGPAFGADNYDPDEDDASGNDDDVLDVSTVEIPVHPFCRVFDLQKHLRLAVHATALREYVYDSKLAEKLILPAENKKLVQMLVEHKGGFRDIIKGKSGGVIILLTGRPGVGKTLTAEVFAEAEERPLYSVQASQLGLTAENLETELLRVLERAGRWNAILLIDEADVYVKERAESLEQNAIVGVFLRVLEYHTSVLFLTTNRPDIVDDAIASRCVARIDYEYPSVDDQCNIWKVLSASSGIKVSEKVIREFATKHPGISGRDVKNLLKLSHMVSTVDEKPITCETIDYCMRFKPTWTNAKGKEWPNG